MVSTPCPTSGSPTFSALLSRPSPQARAPLRCLAPTLRLVRGTFPMMIGDGLYGLQFYEAEVPVRDGSGGAGSDGQVGCTRRDRYLNGTSHPRRSYPRAMKLVGPERYKLSFDQRLSLLPVQQAHQSSPVLPVPRFRSCTSFQWTASPRTLGSQSRQCVRDLDLDSPL